MTKPLWTIDCIDQKYTVLQDDIGRVSALRYGNKWRDLSGDGLVLSLCHQIMELEENLGKSNKILERLVDLSNSGLMENARTNRIAADARDLLTLT